MSEEAPAELWLVRHGQTESNVARVIQGQTDTPLNERGRAQARALGAWIGARPHLGFARLVSSPLSRARATAAALAEATGLPVREDPAWMERNFGECEGRPDEEVYALQDASGDDPFAFCPAGGESTHDMAARAITAAKSLLEEGGRSVVVTHGGPIAAVVAEALALPYRQDTVRRFARRNTGLSVVGHKRGTMRLETLNARPHLWTGCGSAPE